MPRDGEFNYETINQTCESDKEKIMLEIDYEERSKIISTVKR